MTRRLALCVFASCAALASGGLHAKENEPGAAPPGEGSAPIGPYGGVYYTHYVNELYPAPLVGPLLGLEMGLWPADALRVTGGVDYTFNVGQYLASTESFAGSPIGSLRYHAALGLRLPPRVVVSAAYQGGWLAMERGHTLLNAVLVSLSLGLF